MHNMQIALIWVFFGLQIIILAVFFLNFLIAIVNDAYENVNENFVITEVTGRSDLNGELLRGQMSQSSIDNELIVMSTRTGDHNDSNWQGITRQIKKRMDYTDKQLQVGLKETSNRVRNWICDVEDKVNSAVKTTNTIEHNVRILFEEKSSKKKQKEEKKRRLEAGIPDDERSMEDDVEDLRKDVSNMEITLSEMSQIHGNQLMQILNAVKLTEEHPGMFKR